MFTSSAQVLALTATVVLSLCAGAIAFAAPHSAVFPLMAVAVGVMGVERVLLPWNVALAFTRADHEALAAPFGLR